MFLKNSASLTDCELRKQMQLTVSTNLFSIQDANCNLTSLPDGLTKHTTKESMLIQTRISIEQSNCSPNTHSIFAVSIWQ
jgi:hypothetical protein